MKGSISVSTFPQCFTFPVRQLPQACQSPSPHKILKTAARRCRTKWAASGVDEGNNAFESTGGMTNFDETNVSFTGCSIFFFILRKYIYNEAARVKRAGI